MRFRKMAVSFILLVTFIMCIGILLVGKLEDNKKVQVTNDNAYHTVGYFESQNINWFSDRIVK